MNLFSELELFDAGTKYNRQFHLPGAELHLWEQFFLKGEADSYFQDFLTATPWKQRERKMYDRVVADPRLTAFYGGANGNAWTENLLEIKSVVEDTCKISFDRVLLNYYRNGNDSVAWHSDTLPVDGKHHPIASVSFGETRVFKVRHKTDKTFTPIDIPLRHGSFLLMGAGMQENYEHHVPKTSREIGGRINLTFRISEPSKPVYFAQKG